VDWVLLERYLRLLAWGAQYTVYLSIATLILSTLLALPLALISLSSIRIARWGIAVYSWVVRGIPELIILFIAFFGLPQIGVKLDPLPAAVLAFVIFSTAYNLEIFRGGLRGISQGQYEAARALGLPYGRTIRRIILPQLVRIVLPPYATNATTILKRTSLASVIAVSELTATSNRLIVATDRPFEILSLAALLYVLLNSVIIIGERKLERRFRFTV
jgi:His/Glu/Gln/Arg/opine family amino acid ABC transporter permease subunit